MRYARRLLVILIILIAICTGITWATLFVFSHSPRLQNLVSTRLESFYGVTTSWKDLNLSFLKHRVIFSQFVYINKKKTLKLELNNCHTDLNPVFLLKQSVRLTNTACESVLLTVTPNDRLTTPTSYQALIDALHLLDIPKAQVKQVRIKHANGLSVDARDINLTFTAHSWLGFSKTKKLHLQSNHIDLKLPQKETPIALSMDTLLDLQFPLLTQKPTVDGLVTLTERHDTKNNIRFLMSIDKEQRLSLSVKKGMNPLVSSLNLACPLAIITSPQSLSSSTCTLKIDDLRWPSLISSQSTVLARMAETYPTVSFSLSHHIVDTLQKGKGTLTLSLPTHEATPTTQAHLTYDLNPDELVIHSGKIFHDNAREALNLSGTLNKKTGWNLKIKAEHFENAPWLSIFTGQTLDGRFNFDAVLTGPLTHPETHFQFSAEAVNYLLFDAKDVTGRFTLRDTSMQIEASIKGDENSRPSLIIHIDDLYDKTKRRISVDAHVKNLPWTSILHSDFKDARLNGTFTYQSSISSALADAVGKALFQITTLNWGDLHLTRLELALDIQKNIMTFMPKHILIADRPFPLSSKNSLVLTRGLDSLTLEGEPLPQSKIFLKWPRIHAKEMTGTLAFTNFALGPFFPEWPVWDSMNPTLNAEGTLAIPFGNSRNLRLDLKTKAITLTTDEGILTQKDPAHISLLNQNFEIDTLHLISPTQHGTSLLLKINKNFANNQPMTLTLKGDVSGPLLNYFSPDIIVERGIVTLDLTAIPDARNFSGTIILNELQFFPLQSDLELSIPHAILTLSHENVSMQNMTVNWQGGTLIVDGLYNWKTPTNTALKLTLRDFPILLENTFEGSLDGVLDWHGDLISGSLDLLEGRYYRDFKLLDYILKPSDRDTNNPFKQLQTLGSYRLDLSLKDRGGVQVDNNLATLTLGADLNIRGSISNPLLDGSITVGEGRIQLMGFSFDDTQGEMTWRNTPPNRASVFIQATRDLSDYRVHALIQGEFDNLKLTLESDPTLTPNEVLQLLLTGRSPRDQNNFHTSDLFSSEFIASQALSVFEKPLTELSGLDILKIASAPVDNQDIGEPMSSTRLYLGKRFNDRFQLNFSTSLDSNRPYQAFEGEYLLSDHFLIKAGKLGRRRYGFDLTIRFEAD